MAKYKLDFPYVIITTEVTPEDLERHPDPRAALNVRDAMGPLKFKQWVDEWVDGADNPVQVTTKVHIASFVTDPHMLGMTIAYTLMASVGIAALGFLGYGIYTTIKFIGGLL